MQDFFHPPYVDDTSMDHQISLNIFGSFEQCNGSFLALHGEFESQSIGPLLKGIKTWSFSNVARNAGRPSGHLDRFWPNYYYGRNSAPAGIWGFINPPTGSLRINSCPSTVRFFTGSSGSCRFYGFLKTDGFFMRVLICFDSRE